MKLLTGNSNRPLAEAIGQYLHAPFTKAVVRRFADMEVFVEIQENVRGEDMFVIQSTSFPANDNLMETLIIIDALRRSSAKRITAVLPYFGYARQDRKPGPRTPISAKLVANLITEAGASRVLTETQVAALVAEERSKGRRIVFTSGIFDLLHTGHVRYLAEARALGDLLIVGLNADESVRRNKGPGRPITPQDERAEVLAALASVDGVVVFQEDTPADIIRRIQPDILVKGAALPADQIVGRDTVEARGGRMVVVPVEPGYSTTSIVERIRNAR